MLRALARPEARGARLVIGGDGEERHGSNSSRGSWGSTAACRSPAVSTEAALVGHLAACRAVVFVPQGEDYGFVTVEAFAASKPVITCSDSGGPLEFVRSGQNGLVCAPDPAALAHACAEVTESPHLAERLGTQGRQDIAPLSWAAVVKKLVMI